MPVLFSSNRPPAFSTGPGASSTPSKSKPARPDILAQQRAAVDAHIKNVRKQRGLDEPNNASGDTVIIRAHISRPPMQQAAAPSSSKTWLVVDDSSAQAAKQAAPAPPETGFLLMSKTPPSQIPVPVRQKADPSQSNGSTVSSPFKRRSLLKPFLTQIPIRKKESESQEGSPSISAVSLPPTVNALPPTIQLDLLSPTASITSSARVGSPDNNFLATMSPFTRQPLTSRTLSPIHQSDASSQSGASTPSRDSSWSNISTPRRLLSDLE